MCKNLSSSDLQIVLNGSSESIAALIAENMVQKNINDPLDFINTISEEPHFEKQNEICIKMVHAVGGHWDEKAFSGKIFEFAIDVKGNLSYNSQAANTFARILREVRRKPYFKIANVRDERFGNI